MPDGLDEFLSGAVGGQKKAAGTAAPGVAAKADWLDEFIREGNSAPAPQAPPGWPSPATQTAAVRERGGQLPRYEQLRRQPWFGQVDAEFRKAGISTYAWVKNALRESGGDPSAEGDRSKGGTATSFGLFQLHHGGLLDALTKRTKGDLNAAIALAKNPVEAAKIMAQEWKRQGLGNIKDERAQAYAFTRYLEKPAEEIARQVAAQLGQEHVPYQVHSKSPSYAGQPKTKPRTVGVEKAGQAVAKQQRAARLDALVGPRTFDAIHWDVAKPHPWSAGEQALAIFDENMRRAKYGMAREAIVEKTLGGEFPVFVLAADPKQRQYQVSALRALKWPVEDHFAELMKQYPGNRPVAANPWNPEPGYAPSSDDAIAFKQAVTPKALQAVIEERQGRPLTNFQRAALPLISATLQARRDDAMQQGWRVMTGVAAKSAELAAGAIPGAGVAGQALTRGGAAKAAAKAALSPKALGAAAASGAAYEAVSGLGQGDTPAEIAARTGVGAVGGVLGQATLGTAGAAAFGALGFKPKQKALPGGGQKALGAGPNPSERITPVAPPYGALPGGGDQKALPWPSLAPPGEVRVGDPVAPDRVIVSGQRTPVRGERVTTNPGTEVGVGDPVWVVARERYGSQAAEVREILPDGTLRLGERGGGKLFFSGRTVTPDRVYADWKEVSKVAAVPAQPVTPAPARPAAKPAAAPVRAERPSAVPSKPPVVDIDPNVTLNTTAAVARNVFVRAKTGGSARRGTLYGTPVSKQDGEYVLLDVDDPITSHDIDGNLTPEYPPALQGRDRSDKDVRTQVYDLVNRFDPEELGSSFQMQGGMPGLGPDGLVESGNGRMLTLREAYRRDPEGLGYKAWLSKNARAFGFDPEDVAKLERPVVVWRRKGELSDAERVVWAREANSDPKLAPKADEAARMDAEVVARSLQSPQGTQLARALEGAGDELPDGALSAWEELLPHGARVGLRDDKGKFTPAARGRLVQALVHYVFGDSPFSDALAFGGKGGIATLTRAARESIALLARLKATAAAKGDEGKAYGGVFLEALRDAAAEFKAAKESGRKPASGAQIVAAAFNEDDPDAVRLSMRNALLDLFSSRKADDIGDPIREYAERALSILNEGQASSGGLFDEADVAKPKAHALWESVTKKGLQRAAVVETRGSAGQASSSAGTEVPAAPTGSGGLIDEGSMTDEDAILNVVRMRNQSAEPPTLAQIADAVKAHGIPANRVPGIIAKLEAAGKIRKDGEGYRRGTLPAQSGGRPGTLEMAGRKPQQQVGLFRAAELDSDPTEAVRKMLAGTAASAAARLAEKAVGNKTWGDILDEMEAAWKKADYSKIQDEMQRKGSENDRRTALRWLAGSREALEAGPLSEGRKKDLLDLWGKHQNKLRQARYRAKAKAAEAEVPDVLEQAGGRARRWFGSPLGNGAGRAVAIESHQIGGKTPRERFLGAMGQAFKMRPDQQQAYEAVMDAYTAGWGRLTGRAPDEWYADRVKMVAQGRAGVAALGGRGALVSRSPRGAIRFEDTGRAIIAALHSPNLSTAVHEVAHIWRRDLYRALDEAADDAIKADIQANLLVLERAYGVMRDPSAAAGTPGMAPPKKWTPYQEERFARDVERYFRDGLAPTGATPALKQAFAKMKGWFSAIYRRLLGSPVERNISPDVREVLDTMFVGPAYAVQAREARARAKATAEMVLPAALRGKARRVTPGGRYWKVTVPEAEAAGWAERHPDVWVPNGQPAIKDGQAEILFMLPERRVPDPKPGLETAKHWAARAVMPKGTVKAGDRPDPALFQQVAFVAGAVRTYAETMGRYGRELAAGMRNVDFTAEYNNGQHVDDIVTMFRGKSRKFIQEVVRYDRRRELLALPENRGKTMADLAPGTAPEVVAAADNLRSIMDDWLLRPAQELGVKRAGRQLLGGGSAVPRHWSPKGRAFLDDLLKDTNDDSWKGSPRVKAVIDHLIAGGIYKDVGAAEKGLLKYRASQMAKTMLRDPDYFASDRTLRGLPDEFFDDNLLDWIGTDLHGMHRYLAARQEWGNNIEAANALIEGLNAEPWHRDQLRKQIEVIYGGRPGVSRISEKLSRFNMAYQVGSKLSGLVFPLVNLPQGIVSSTDWGLMNSLRAAAMALQRHRAPENQPEIIRAVRRSGAVTDVFGDVGGTSLLARAAKGPATWSETQGYYTVALAAAQGLDRDLAVLRDIEAAKLSPDGKRLQAILRNLASMGSETEKKTRYRLEHVLQMTPEEMAEAIARGSATPAQVARAMQFMVQDRMHRKTLSQQPPLHHTSAIFKNATLFRAFEVRQFLLLLNMAKRAVAMGEVRPLIQTTIAMGVAGAMSQWAWSMGSGRGGRGTLIGEIVEGIQDDGQFDEKAIADRAGHAMALGGMPAMQLWSMDQKNVDTILRDAAWGVTGSSVKNIATAAYETARRPENWQEQGKELLTREFRLGREAARMTRWVANRDTDIRPELQELKDRMRLGQDKKVYQESNNPDSVLLRRMAGFLEVGNLEHALTIAMKYRDLNPEKDVKAALRSSMMARGPRGGLSEAKWNDLLDTLPGRKRAMAVAIDEQWKDRVLAVTGGL